MKPPPRANNPNMVYLRLSTFLFLKPKHLSKLKEVQLPSFFSSVPPPMTTNDLNDCHFLGGSCTTKIFFGGGGSAVICVFSSCHSFCDCGLLMGLQDCNYYTCFGIKPPEKRTIKLQGNPPATAQLTSLQMLWCSLEMEML